MTLRAAFFDVGDTLVEHWAPRDVVHAKARERLAEALGEREWLAELVDADLEPAETKGGWPFVPEHAKQETLRWYERWFRDRGIKLDGTEVERIRTLLTVPLDEVSMPVPGAFDALRWCADRGLRVVLVTNTLMRGDEEVLEDWRRFGLKDVIHGVVSSHSAGWRKPHPAIFERALELAEADPSEAFHVGDNLVADVWGAKQLGLRAVWRRTETSEDHPPVDVRPDAVVRDLTELPGIVARWLEAKEAPAAGRGGAREGRRERSA